MNVKVFMASVVLYLLQVSISSSFVSWFDMSTEANTGIEFGRQQLTTGSTKCNEVCESCNREVWVAV